MELGPENHNGDGLLEPNSIIVVYMDPLGNPIKTSKAPTWKRCTTPRNMSGTLKGPPFPSKNQTDYQALLARQAPVGLTALYQPSVAEFGKHRV